MTVVALGIDPGERWTGVVLRHGSDLLHWQVIDRDLVCPTAGRVTNDYMSAVEDAVRSVLDQHQMTGLLGTPEFLLGLEDFTDPIGYEQVRPKQLIGTGRVLGWLQRAFPDAVLVAPTGAGHGRRPLSTYPAALVSGPERADAIRARAWHRPPGRKSDRRHARAAWDIAGDALGASRLEAAIRKDARRGRLA